MVCRKRRSSSTTSTVPLALIVPCPPQRALRPHLSLPSSTSRLDTYPVRAGTGPGSGLVTASPGARPLRPCRSVASWVPAPGARRRRALALGDDDVTIDAEDEERADRPHPHPDFIGVVEGEQALVQRAETE